MRALSCQSAWWSWPVELLTCVYWTRPAPHYPGRTSCLPSFTFPSLSLSHAFFFTLFLSITITPFVCLSPSFSTEYHFLFSFSPFVFLKPTSPPLSCTVNFFWLSSLLLFFYYPFVSLLPLSCCPFLFCIILGLLFVSPSVFGLKPRCLYGGVLLFSAPG